MVLERVGDAAVEPDEKTIQGTWEVVDCTTAETPPVYASALMDIYAILYKGQSVTITRHTIGPEDAGNRDSSAASHFHASGVGGVGGMGGGMGGFGFAGGMDAVNSVVRGAMSFGRPWGYALNPATSPKSIDLVSASGMTLQGSYEISGDRLKMCLGVRKERAAGPDNKSALIVLRRVTGGRRAEKPRSSSLATDFATPFGKLKPLRPLVVDVDRDGTARIAGMPIADDGLDTLVGLLLGQQPGRQVRLRCDPDLPFSRAGDLLALLKTAGLSRSSLLLATAPTPPARLDFRIAATHAKDGEKPLLSEAEIKRYLKDLQAHGPTYPRAAREQAQRIAWQNALASVIALLQGVEKASVGIDGPLPGEGEPPPTVSVSLTVETPPARLLDKNLLQTVRDLVAAAVPGVDADNVKVLTAAAKPAADAKVKDAKPAAAERAAAEPYAWFELDAEASSSLVTAAHEGRNYVLLALRPDRVMLAGDEGSRQWRIEDASLGKAAPGRQAVRVTLDGAGTAPHGGLGPGASRHAVGRLDRRPRGLPVQDAGENQRRGRDRRQLRRSPGGSPFARALGTAGRDRRGCGCDAGGRRRPARCGVWRQLLLTFVERDDERGN